MLRLTTLTAITLFSFTACFAQARFDEVSYDRIPHKKIVEYLVNQQQTAAINTFSELKPTCAGEVQFDGFRSYTKHYRVKAKLEDVWQTYIGASPTESWRTRKSSVDLIYDRVNDQFFYSEDQCQGSAIGQVMYLNLRLVKGLYRLATSLEITDIRDDQATIEISYVESGVNQGKQWISMVENGDGYTEITHTSMIKSESPFRDKYLYPYFHNKLINAFHRNMRKRVAGNDDVALN